MATALILLVPFLAMQLDWNPPDPGSSSTDQGVNWTVGDFIAAGVLLFGAGSLFVLAARKVDKKYRLAVGIGVLALLLWLWAELAVGVFTDWGS